MMTEREMEDLLWTQSERLLGEPLRPFRRQATGEGERTELIFVDRGESLLIVGVRHGKLERGAIPGIVDRRGELKKEFPDRAVEMMLVANQIPGERRLACERLDIDAREIAEERFQEAASETGEVFAAEPGGGAGAVEAEIAQAAPLHAEVIEEPAAEHLHEGPAATAEGTTERYPAFRGRKRHSTAGTLALVLGLLAVGTVAYWFRKELSEGFDQLRAAIWGKADEPAKEPGAEPARETPKSEPAHKPPVKPKVGPTGPGPAATEPPPVVEPAPTPAVTPAEPEPTPPAVKPKEHASGVAYSILEEHDLSRGEVFQYELKVLVPGKSTHEDLARMASDVVGAALKKGLCHAMHFYCFADKKKTNPGDAFAEVVWAPEGDFARAAEAVGAGSEKNQYNVILIRNEP
jgi:hypothetical protein